HIGSLLRAAGPLLTPSLAWPGQHEGRRGATGRYGWMNALLPAARRDAVQGPAEGGEGDQRQEPPGVYVRDVGQDRRDGQATHDKGGDVPVVADDEVVPECAERLEVLHQATTSDCLAG